MTARQALAEFEHAGDMTIATVSHWYPNVPIHDLEWVWPWRRVRAWYEHIRMLEWRRHLPAYTQIADFRNVNRGKNTKAVTVFDVMPEMFVPEAVLKDAKLARGSGNGNKWTKGVVDSFALLVKNRRAGNALLNALHISDLRASGYDA